MENGQTFKIVIAHDNFSAATRAEEMAERLAARFDFVCDSWPFELLACERVRETAAFVASGANMIIIAAENRKELPDSVKHWIENWLAQKSSDPSVLVGLLYENQAISEKPSQTCAYLQEAAHRGKMDFFCNVGRWWQEEAVPAGDHSPSPSFVEMEAENHSELTQKEEPARMAGATAVS